MKPNQPGNQPLAHALAVDDAYTPDEILGWAPQARRARDEAVQEATMRVESDHPGMYDIRVQGRLDASWSDWLDDVILTFQETPDGRGITTLRCRLDQAALRGLLTRLWDRNLAVLSVEAAVASHPLAPEE
jgi:cobalamin biosynthesis Mg chelatase CobN